MKIMRIADSKSYEAAGHFNVTARRLYNPNEISGGRLSVGLSTFEPDGGSEFANAPVEMLYFIVGGEITLTTDEGKTVLRAGDCVLFAPGDGRAVFNSSDKAVDMLVVAVAPA